MRGKFSEHQTVRSILRSLPKSPGSDVIGAGIGEDYGRLLLHPDDGAVDILTAAGVCMDDGPMTLTLDMSRLYNSIRIGGCVPYAMTDTIVYPCDDERGMKRLLKRLADMGGQLGIDIVSGHTEINDSVSIPVISVTMLGKRPVKTAALSGTYKPGYDIVMCGQTGIGGTLERYCAHMKELHERYSESYLSPVMELRGLLTLDGQPDIAMRCGISFAHDISRGGVYAALWELGDALGTGFQINHDAIPILQETIEICEFTGDNPYTIDGCGAALFVTASGQELADRLYEAGYEAEVIGKLTGDKGRVVVHDGEMRYLTPPTYI